MLAPEREGPVEESEAVAPVIVGGAVVGAAAIGVATGYHASNGGWLEGTGDDVTENDEYSQTEYKKTSNEVAAASATIYGMTQHNMQMLIDRTEYMDGIAFRKARVTYAEALQANESKSTARQMANQTIDDYIAKQQKNLIQTHDMVWEERQPHLEDTIKGHPDHGGAKWHAVSQDYKPIVGGTLDKTLANGETVSYATWTWKQSGTTYGNGRITDYDTDSSPREYPIEYTCQDDSGCTHEETFYELADTNQAWTNIWDAHNISKNNINTLIDNTYDEYENGTLNDSDIIGPAAAAQELDTQKSQPHAAAALANMGINGSIQTQVQLEGLNHSRGLDWYNGTLFTDWQPNGTDGQYKTGGYYTPHPGDHAHTLDTDDPHADASQQQQVYVATDGGTIHKVNQTFRVHALYDQDTGESVTNITTKKEVTKVYNQTSINASVFDEMDRLNAKLRNLSASGSGGGSIAFLSGITPEQAALGVGGGLGGLYVINRMTNPPAARRRR
jgi:hypothetical protein